MADTIRNMTEEELRRARAAQREPSDPLAWGPEKGVETDETTWDLLQFLPLGKAATRIAGYLRKKGVTTAEKGAEAILKEAVAEAPKVAPKALPKPPPKDATLPLGELEAKWGAKQPETTFTPINPLPNYMKKYEGELESLGGNYYRKLPEPGKRTDAEERFDRVRNGLDFDSVLDTINFNAKKNGVEVRPETIRALEQDASGLKGVPHPFMVDKLRFIRNFERAERGEGPISTRELLSEVMREGGNFNDAVRVYGYDYFPTNGQDTLIVGHIGRARTAARQLKEAADPNEISRASRAFEEHIRRADDIVMGARRQQRSRPDPQPEKFDLTAALNNLADQMEMRPPPKRESITPDTIREAMRRNKEEGTTLAEVTKEGVAGRPWPDFITDRVPIEHNNETFWLDRQGNVFLTKTEPRPIYTTGVTQGQEGIPSTDYTFYSSNKYNTQTNPELKGLAAKVRQKLSEIHGNVLSDSRGLSSELAQKSWAKTPGTQDIRNLPRVGEEVENLRSKFILKHPEGGNIKGIIEDLKRRGFGQHITEEDVAAYLKHYGGNALVGAAGLAGFAKYLQDKDK